MAENVEPMIVGEPSSSSPEKSASTGGKESEVQHEGTEQLPDEAEPAEDQPRRLPHRWWQRPTVRALRREQESHRDYRDQRDEQANNSSRLPAGESVHLGGLVLTEAFSPSTVSALYDALRRWPDPNDRDRDKRIADLDQSRSSGGGWGLLGVVRPPGEFIIGNGYNDSELPGFVTAVWLHLEYLMPSLAVVVATFTFRDEAADVSSLLRSDYQTHVRDVHIHVYGKFGWLRGRLPWARPRNYGITASISGVRDEKRRAFEEVVQERQAQCSKWFTSRFHGRFALANPVARPIIRLIFTEEELPFINRRDWFVPVGLNWSPTVYRSVDIPGWALKDSTLSDRGGRFVLTVAARRRDAAREPTKGETGEENWYLTQRFATDQGTFVARYAIHALIALYGERLARLRDGARVRRRFKRPVRDARVLDEYLTTDGLDAATVTADVDVLTKDLSRFRWGVPEYTEDRDNLPASMRPTSPLELVPTLCSLLKEQAARLASDTENTAENIRASAELRQAIANTRLQRTVMVVSLAALIVAIVGIILAIQLIS